MQITLDRHGACLGDPTDACLDFRDHLTSSFTASVVVLSMWVLLFLEKINVTDYPHLYGIPWSLWILIVVENFLLRFKVAADRLAIIVMQV